jgi:Aminomethyltransferase folate-binding domain
MGGVPYAAGVSARAARPKSVRLRTLGPEVASQVDRPGRRIVPLPVRFVRCVAPMEQATVTPLKKTPLNARHRALGAKMVSFGGWDMPVEYSGIVNEHLAVRTRAGLFDVSHMGEIEIAGKDALAAVQRISSNDASKLAVGQAQYSGLLTPQGTFIDDLLVYRLAPAHFLLVVNASHIPKDYAWIAEQIKPAGDAVAVDASARSWRCRVPRRARRCSR